MILIFFFIFSLFLTVNSFFVNKRGDSILSVIVILLYLSLFGFNYKQGVDWYNYLPMYAGDIEKNAGIEYGYQLLQEMFSSLGINFWFFSLMIKIFFWYTCFSLVNRITRYTTASIFFFIVLAFPFLNENLRQMIAVAIMFIAVKKINSYSLIYITALIIAASVFHISVLLTYPFFILYRNKRFADILLYILPVIFLMSLLSYEYISNIIYIFINVIPSGFYNKIVFYMNSASSEITLGFILRFLLLYIVYVFLRKFLDKDRYLWLIWVGFLYLTSIEIIFHEVDTLWIRMREYFIIFFPLVFFKIVEFVKYSKVLVFIFMFCYVLYSSINSFISTSLFQHYVSPQNYIFYISLGNDIFSETRTQEVITYWAEWGSNKYESND